MSSAATGDFLHRALAGGALDVGELEMKARAAGLLGERQEIQHAKRFKKAKKALGIRSVRAGFGSSGNWVWFMPPQTIQKTGSANSSKENHSVHDAERTDKRATSLESGCVGECSAARIHAIPSYGSAYPLAPLFGRLP